MKDKRLEEIYLINRTCLLILGACLFMFAITGSAMFLIPGLGVSILAMITTILISG